MGFDISQNKLTVIVPFSVMEVIKKIHDHRIGDRETSVTKTSIAVELLKLGARIEKKKLDRLEKGESEYDNRLEEQLSFIARNVLRTQLKIDSFFSIYSELQNVSPDLIDRILAETKLSEKERALLQRLFVPLD